MGSEGSKYGTKSHITFHHRYIPNETSHNRDMWHTEVVLGCV